MVKYWVRSQKSDKIDQKFQKGKQITKVTKRVKARGPMRLTFYAINSQIKKGVSQLAPYIGLTKEERHMIFCALYVL